MYKFQNNDEPNYSIPTHLTQEEIQKNKLNPLESECFNSFNLTSSGNSCPISNEIRTITEPNCQTSIFEYSTASHIYNTQNEFHIPLDFPEYNTSKNETESLSQKKEKNPLKCDFLNCGKTFPYASDLKRHAATHNKKEGFTCSVCQKIFTRKDNLTAHERIHSNDKPFECTYPGCDEKFKNHSSLKNHSLKHVVQGYKCKFMKCLKKFDDKKEMDRHYFLIHGCDPLLIDQVAKNSDDDDEKTKEKKKEFVSKINQNESFQKKSKKFKIQNCNEFLDSLISSNSNIPNQPNFDVFFDDLQSFTSHKS